MFLKILQISRENTCVEDSSGLQLYQEVSPTQLLSVEFAKFLRTPNLKKICEWLLLKPVQISQGLPFFGKLHFRLKVVHFTKIRGKHLRRSLFFNKAVGRFATLFKKRLWYRYFSVNFVKFLKTYFSPNTSWRLLPYICFSFCIIIPSFVRQFYNQKQSSGGVLQKAILTSFAKFTRKHLH